MEPDAGGGVGSARRTGGRTPATAWVPATDIFARGEDLVVRVSLSGVDREDVGITLSNSVLTVSGERESELDEDAVSFYVRERYYVAFRQSITLPAGIDEYAISADFENGLLEITVRGRHRHAGAAPNPDQGQIQLTLPKLRTLCVKSGSLRKSRWISAVCENSKREADG